MHHLHYVTRCAIVYELYYWFTEAHFSYLVRRLHCDDLPVRSPLLKRFTTLSLLLLATELCCLLKIFKSKKKKRIQGFNIAGNTISTIEWYFLLIHSSRWNFYKIDGYLVYSGLLVASVSPIAADVFQKHGFELYKGASARSKLPRAVRIDAATPYTWLI